MRDADIKVVAMRSQKQRKRRVARREFPYRIYSAAELAAALSVSRMTVLPCIDERRLPRTRVFLHYQGVKRLALGRVRIQPGPGALARGQEGRTMGLSPENDDASCNKRD
jgi:hypothetical protein